MVEHALKRLPPDALTTDTALLVTDAEGFVLGTWDVVGRLRQHLARAGLMRSRCIGEGAIGVSGASALVTRTTVRVAGPAHGLTALHPFTSIGAVVTQPTTGRTLLCLCQISSGDDADASWLETLAEVLNRDLLHESTEAERVLMEHFLAERRDSRHAVVALNAQVILTNAAAARLVGVEEQARLWEYARHVIVGRESRTATLEVGRELALKVECEPVCEPRGETIGVLMRLRRTAGAESPGPGTEALQGLAGRGAKWRTMSRRLAAAGNAATLVVGERGTGKSAIARAVARGESTVEVDVADLDRCGPGEWLDRVRGRIAGCPTGLVVRHLELLPPQEGADLGRLLLDVPSGTRVLGTSTTWPSGDAAGGVFDAFAAVVPVPPLRERVEDIPDLVRTFTAAYVADHPELSGVQWMSDALQVLGRVDWPGNVASLEGLVRRVLSRVRTGYVSARDLPAGLVANASHRNLMGLERVEAQAILQAIQDHDGNKVAAADALGIARSTLYRKMRALGIDISSSTY